jgi:hypothetical protein
MLVALAGLAQGASAQQPPRFELERVGLSGDGYDSERGWTNSMWGDFPVPWTPIRPAWYSGRTATQVNGERRGSHAWVHDRASGAAVRVGLYDDGHTRLDGVQNSAPHYRMNESVLLGHSSRAHSPTVFVGESAWAFDVNSGLTTRAGLYDAEHQSGRLLHNQWQGTSAGVLAYGQAQRNNAQGTLSGVSAWVYDTRSRLSTRVGLLGELYVGGGYAWSAISQITATGHVLGRSSYRAGTNWERSDHWVYDHTTGVTLRLGLGSGAPRTAADRDYTEDISMNDAGQIVGTTSGLMTLPSSEAWRLDAGAAAARVIGLRGAPFESAFDGVRDTVGRIRADGTVYGGTIRWRSDGAHDRHAWINHPVAGTREVLGLRRASDEGRPIARADGLARVFATGTAVGTTSRRSVSGQLSQEVWVRDESGVREIGLREPGLAGAEGPTEWTLNVYDDGAVVGASGVRAANEVVGNKLWLHDIASRRTHKLGLSGGRYTGSDGREEGRYVGRSATGHYFGEATSFAGVTPSFTQAWVWSAATQKTTELGLNGPDYIYNGRLLSSTISLLSDSGVAAGTSVRVNITAPTAASASVGSVAWYYDPATGISHDVLAGAANVVRRSDNYASATAEVLTPEGYLLGRYRQIDDEAGVYGRERAYLYRPDVGFHDIQSLIVGEGNEQVHHLQLNFSVHEGLQLLAQGYLRGQTPEDGRSLFILRPVPTPVAAGVLVLLGVSALGRRARR